MMAAHGTPNVAVVSGTFRTHHSRLGGLSIYLSGDDGHTYYYAHLSQVVGPDRRVAQGEVIGRTGSTGDATTPHTHFEFHPNGGRAVSSYSLLKAHC
jgi:murein DD-endopeptidase MepM/ murein hydrolase activator NlpD